MDSARVIVEVQAGVVPGTAMDEHTRRWAITSDEWRQAEQDQTSGTLLAETNGRAQGYAALLMLQPNAVNWVRTDWLWL